MFTEQRKAAKNASVAPMAAPAVTRAQKRKKAKAPAVADAAAVTPTQNKILRAWVLPSSFFEFSSQFSKTY